MTELVCFFFAREAAGASATRRSLRPLYRGTPSCKNPGAIRVAGSRICGREPGKLNCSISHPSSLRKQAPITIDANLQRRTSTTVREGKAPAYGSPRSRGRPKNAVTARSKATTQSSPSLWLRIASFPLTTAGSNVPRARWSAAATDWQLRIWLIL